MVVKTVWYLRYDAALKVGVEEKGFLPKEATSRKASIAVWRKVNAFWANQTMHGDRSFVAESGNFRKVSIAGERASESSVSQSGGAVTQ